MKKLKFTLIEEDLSDSADMDPLFLDWLCENLIRKIEEEITRLIAEGYEIVEIEDFGDNSKMGTKITYR